MGEILMRFRYKLNLMSCGVCVFLALLYACYGRLGMALTGVLGAFINWIVYQMAESRHEAEMRGEQK